MEEQAAIKIKVDPGKASGIIRRLHGTNLGPHLLNDMPNVRDYGDDLKALDIPLMRLHDAPLDNRGRLLVDIPLIFPLFHADHNDPRNYYFKQTDDYIEGCLKTGAKILDRLGVSIEHTKNKYLTAPPPDFGKWAEICANVIRHYNEGWADGFHHNIEYWEIWNEADLGPKMWAGTWTDYIELYAVSSKKLKSLFPNIKVGGPAMVCIRDEFLTEFLEACKESQAPLDFFSWHGYTNDPKPLIDAPSRARAILDRHGFEKTELNLNEWHYYPGNWEKMNTDREHLKWLSSVMGGADSAAFIAATLSGWQDTPIDSANFYVGTDMMGFWGIFDHFGARNKCYYALKAFNAVTKHPNRIKVQLDSANGIWALAGQDESGKTAVLISCFKSDKRKIELELVEARTSKDNCKVKMLDASNDLQEYEGFEVSTHGISIEKPEGSAVILVEISKIERAL